MLSIAAHYLGIPTICIDPNPQAGAHYVTDMLVGDFNDQALLAKFSQGVTVATYETENIPVETAEYFNQVCHARPALKALQTAQDRLLEKTIIYSIKHPNACLCRYYFPRRFRISG